MLPQKEVVPSAKVGFEADEKEEEPIFERTRKGSRAKPTKAGIKYPWITILLLLFF